MGINLNRPSTTVFRFWEGVAGANSDDVLLTAKDRDVEFMDTFMLKNDAGSVRAEVDLGDGVFVGPVALSDLSANTVDPVLATVAGQLFGFRGSYKRIRIVDENGDATGVVLRGFQSGR